MSMPVEEVVRTVALLCLSKIGWLAMVEITSWLPAYIILAS